MYHALYRKYRPTDFDSVVGQEAIVQTLKNSIINGKFSHAYLFYGPRGTGKTTISKIFARNVNCLDSKDGLACRKCSACNFSFSKDCVDIIEIDAASNNGVDEIRDLKDKINLVPSELRYKVYIIDEVHMLSLGAFNALLKTLEEPPEHVIFILATTDFQKVPTTIVSRCQCFSFNRISKEAIISKLEYVCEKENINIEIEVLNKIALLSDGGLRDALGSLDKLLSYSNDKITLDTFNELNGIVSDDEIIKFLKAIFDGNIVDVLEELNKFNNMGKNLIQILVQCIDILRNSIVDYYISKKVSPFSLEKSQIFINLLNEKMFDIKRSNNVKVYVEIFILKFINDYILSSNLPQNKAIQFIDSQKEIKKVVEEPKNEIKQKKNFENIREIETKSFDISNNLSKPVIVNKENIRIIKNITEIMKIRVNNTFVSANKNLLKDEMIKFDSLRDYSFDQNYGYIVCNILDGKLRLVGEDSLVISYEYDSNVKNNLNIIEKINKIYNNLTKSNKKIAIISDEYWEKVKNEYMVNLKNNKKYEFIDEPEVIFEEIKNDDIISNSAIDLFGDIVEVD